MALTLLQWKQQTVLDLETSCSNQALTGPWAYSPYPADCVENCVLVWKHQVLSLLVEPLELELLELLALRQVVGSLEMLVRRKPVGSE
jgi:hypothetical protein